MLAFLGLFTIVMLLVLIMSRKLSAVVALIVLPIITGLMAGFGLELVDFITEGLREISTITVMFVFAILFFGVLMDAGTFEPLISKILKIAGNDPVRITIATALLAMIVHLDGSGAVTFLIVVPAMLPIYDELGMKRTTLATIVALAAGTMNILPWGGPTMRAASALNVSVTELFNPLLVPVIAGLISVMVISYILGCKERKTIKIVKSNNKLLAENKEELIYNPRKKLLNIINYLLIIIAIFCIITGWVPPHVVFLIGFALALSINYPDLAEQRKRIDSHAKAALLMASILFAAGCFTGILQGTGMIKAMAVAAINYIPSVVGNNLAVITGVSSMPASLLFDPDSFYFGILPILATTAEHFDGNILEVGRGAIIGQMTTGFAVSPLTGATFLLVGLTGVELGSHQKKTIPLAFLITLIILAVAIFMGAIS